MFLAAMVATLVGCEPVQVLAPLPAHSFGANIDSLAFEGVLAFDEPCLYLTAGEFELNILWPAGYTRSGDPPVVVRDDGKVIARVGDSVLIGGVSADVVGGAQARRQIAPPGCSPRPGLLLGVIASVNGVEVPGPQTQPPPPAPRLTERPKPR